MEIRRFHVRAHVFHQIYERFSIKERKKQVVFLKNVLKEVKVDKVHNFRISFLNEEYGVCLKAQIGREPGIIVLMTIYPVEGFAPYQLRHAKYYNGKIEEDYSKIPMLFDNKML